MNIRKSLIILSVSLCAFTSIAQDEGGSKQPPKTYTLQEVVVESERGWFEGDKAVFIPTRQEKNLSDSPESLLESMHLPLVRRRGGDLCGLNGEPVVIFINGERANDTDIATFWPRHVHRIEYMENPSDPRFEGAAAVVNFIMTEYAAGGVTKVSGFQRIPNFGEYGVASKLVYRRMTYGLQFRGQYMRDHRSGTSGTETFRDLYYDGVHYDEIARSFHGNSWIRDENINLSVNARYTATRFRATHTFAMKWDRDPGSGENTVDVWSPDLFNAVSSSRRSTSRLMSPQLSGNYSYTFNEKWYLGGWWRYSYGHHDITAMNRTGEMAEIFNRSREDVHSAGFMLCPTWNINSSLKLQASAGTTLDWFSSSYSGSTDVTAMQRRELTSVAVSLGWDITPALYLSVRPGINSSYFKVGDLSGERTTRPTIRTDMQWNVNRRLFLAAQLSYRTQSPGPSQTDDVLLRSSELLWRRGNPYLKDFVTISPGIQGCWMPSNRFTVTGTVMYSSDNHEAVNAYVTSPADMGGLLMTNINAGRCDYLWTEINIDAFLFNRKLYVNLQPAWTHERNRGEYAGTHDAIDFHVYASYRVGNCRFGANYNTPWRRIFQAGMIRQRTSGGLDLKFTYVNGNLYLNLDVNNIFNTYRRVRKSTDSSHYTLVTDGWNTGRNISLRLSYTFGYGKKVDPRIDIDGPDDVKTSTNL